MKIIKCKCGNNIDKIYNLQDVILGEGTSTITRYVWYCDNCGQKYYEKVKEPIELK